MGQKTEIEPAILTSVLPSTADIRQRGGHVRKVPTAEVARVISLLLPPAGNSRARTAERRRVTLEVLLCGGHRLTIQPAIDGCERPIQKHENQVQARVF
jgi:hypothetical protein